ncbi:MAG: hypothetical protein AAFV96_14045 [Pseudomonadota bacterium]
MFPFLAAMATAQAQTLAAMSVATASAATALMRAPTMEMRDLTVYFPFGQGFSQDIDPVTTWTTTWMLPFSFGMFPAGPRAAALITEIRSQQALVDRLIEACDAAEKARTIGDPQERDAPLTAAYGPLGLGEMEALRQTKDNLQRLIGPARGRRGT